MPQLKAPREPLSGRPQRGRALIAAAALCAALAQPAAATPAAQPGRSAAAAFAGDPFEPLNRVLFRLHQALDAAVFRPAALTYQHLIPRVIRLGVHNAVVNLGEPRTALNDALQGRDSRALKSLARFSLNTTIGLAGLFDVAAKSGLPAQPNDFGATLGHLGVATGPYLFVPLMGPSTVRDVVGGLADLGLNPLTYARYPGDTQIAVTSVVTEGLQQRAAADGDLKALEATATDVYATFRSYYLQNREATISGGRIDLKALPEFGDDPGAGGEAPPAPPAARPPGAADRVDGRRDDPRESPLS